MSKLPQVTYLLVIFLGLVQGLTEFLPVSSTGHLIIVENLFGISQKDFGLAFDASLHLGTLLAILAFFAKDYLNILNFKNKLFINLLVGTVPAVLFGIVFERLVETTFRQIWIVAASLILFSFVLLLAEKLSKRNRHLAQIKPIDALIVGLFQSLALIPGISRSGATISAGLFLGLRRQEAARFAFMLSGPIIAGAGTKKFLDVLSQPSNGDQLTFFLIGMISSAFFGYLTIQYFLKYLQTKTLYPFVFYRIVVGLLLLATILI